MERTKKWHRTSGRQSALLCGNSTIATIDRAQKGGKILSTIGGDTYAIATAGNFNAKVIITDEQDNVALQLAPEKWLSTSYLFSYQGQDYKLLVRNNPLAEYVIMQGAKECLAYGLDIVKETRKAAVRIRECAKEQPAIFHVLLWYFFEPIAIEQTSNYEWWIWDVAGMS